MVLLALSQSHLLQGEKQEHFLAYSFQWNKVCGERTRQNNHSAKVAVRW